MNNDILQWNREGLIPGPNESEETYRQRVAYCLNLDKETLPLKEEEKADKSFLSSALSQTKELFDIVPEWIPLFFSNYKLAPWHGGCAWIFQVTENSPTGAIFQLRRSFWKSTKYLGMYDRDELIAHELAHVGRMVFEEPIFEEFHAYRTSKSSFRRWLGPIIQSPRESILFILLFPLIFFALIRLIRRQFQFKKCLNNLSFFSNPNAVIYRLTDKEIIDFGKMNSQQITNYMNQQKEKSLRWQVISIAYL